MTNYYSLLAAVNLLLRYELHWWTTTLLMVAYFRHRMNYTYTLNSHINAQTHADPISAALQLAYLHIWHTNTLTINNSHGKYTRTVSGYHICNHFITMLVCLPLDFCTSRVRVCQQHLPATAYDNITQLVSANQITSRTTHLLSGPTTEPNGSSSSAIVNAVDTDLLHHHQQQQQLLLNTKAAGAGAGAGAGASAAKVVTATHSAIGLNEALIGSPTAAYNVTHQQQQPLQGTGGGGTLPPGLGSGSAYILNSLINSNESCNINGSISGSNGGLHHNVVGGTIGRTTMLHHHQQQQQSHHPLPLPHPLAYNTLAGTTSVNASGRHHHSALPSMLLTSQTSASLSGIGLLLNASNNNSSSSGGASGLGLSMTGAATVSAASTATTSCNSSSDLDDNININAIKDCLMTQRVPESCVWAGNLCSAPTKAPGKSYKCVARSEVSVARTVVKWYVWMCAACNVDGVYWKSKDKLRNV